MSSRTRRRRRRSRDEWAGVLERFRASGLSARAFCTHEGLGYASFCAWRRKLAEGLPMPTTTSTPSAPPETAFIDLGPMAAPAGKAWAVELELGGGVVVRLRRG
jgi:hypothetical protein